MEVYIRAADERIARLSHNVAALSSQLVSHHSPRSTRPDCAAGQIISLSSRVGSVACIMARFLFSVVNSAVSWGSKVFPSR